MLGYFYSSLFPKLTPLSCSKLSMNPSSEGPPSNFPPEDERAQVVTELNDNDVLLGRGAVSHKGNVRFRQIVAGRRDEYMSISKRQQKDCIARQVISAVAQQGGRFLKRIESIEVVGHVVPVRRVAWTVVDEATVVLKVKQALRERETGQAHKLANEDPSPRPTKKHQPDAHLQGASDLYAHQSQATSESSRKFSARPSSTTATIGTHSIQDTLPLGEQYELLLKQLLDTRTNPTATTTQDAHRLRDALSRQPATLNSGTSAETTALDIARTGLPHSYAPLYGNIGHPSPGTSLDNLLGMLRRYKQPADIPPVLASWASSFLDSQIRQQPLAAWPDYSQAAAPSGSSGVPFNDRLQALLAALQGRDTGLEAKSREEERVTPRRSLTRDVGGVGSVMHQHQHPPQRTTSNFFPQDLQAETEALVALVDSTRLDSRDHDGLYLAFSLTEMLILSVLTSLGIPTWSSSKLDRGEMFSPIKKPSSGPSMYQISWYEFSQALQQAAKDWRDYRQVRVLTGVPENLGSSFTTEVEDRAVTICSSYTADSRQLAKTTVCILEKMRRFLEAMRGEATANTAGQTTGDRSSSWMENEIKVWAETLECQTAERFPVAYTASDFLATYPENKDNSSFKLVSHCDLKAAQTIWKQIVVLSHTRSMATSLSSTDDLYLRLETSLMGAETLSWESMPRWWSLNSFYFDTELLKIMLSNGYVGVLSSPFSASPAAASASAEPMTFAKLGITCKRLLQDRFEQLAGLLASTEDDSDILEPRIDKRVEERTRALRKFA